MNVRLTAVAALFVTAATAVTACGSSPAPATASPAPATATDEHHHATTTTTGAAKEPGEAKVGDTTKCPVSGEEFVVEATSPKTEIDGKTYYFCCAGCKKKFESDPAKFGAKKG